MTDLAPDGRARLAGKRGTGIGKVRGEGGIFLPKKSGASEESVRMRAEDFCRKKRGLISDGTGPRAKRKAAICSGDRGRGARKALRKEQSRLSGGVFAKNKTPTGRGFGSASGGPHPHHPKGS